MKNKTLAQDYVDRSEHRLAAVEVLFQRGSWADVVRESQKIVELALKALLRTANVEVPRIHDVSDILVEQKASLPAKIRPSLEKLVQISRSLRRDRELAFYGSEDLTPSEFYKRADAEAAREGAGWVVQTVRAVIGRKSA